MAETIPDDLAEKFCEAVQRYAAGEWTAAAEIRDRQIIRLQNDDYSIEAICHLVDGFNDRLPDVIHRLLLDQTHADSSDLQRWLRDNQTYAGAARCLLELMKRRIAFYGRR
jgi:hypothetical protein